MSVCLFGDGWVFVSVVFVCLLGLCFCLVRVGFLFSLFCLLDVFFSYLWLCLLGLCLSFRCRVCISVDLVLAIIFVVICLAALLCSVCCGFRGYFLVRCCDCFFSAVYSICNCCYSCSITCSCSLPKAVICSISVSVVVSVAKL